MAQDSLRSVGIRTAVMVAEDGVVAAGTAIGVGAADEHCPEDLRAGFIEGMLQRGVKVYEEVGGRDAVVRYDLVARGPVDGIVTVSVLGLAQEDHRYVFSRAYAVPINEPSLVEVLLAPVVVISAVVLAVYLLLTVRSS